MDHRARAFSRGVHAVTDVALATGAGVIAGLVCYPIYGVAEVAKRSLRFFNHGGKEVLPLSRGDHGADPTQECVPLQQQEKMSVH